MVSLNRRSFLQATAAACAGAALVGDVTAQYDGQPDHVTLQGLDVARDLLEAYQPRLVLDGVEIEPDALYCWRATSAEYRLDWYQYIAYYPYQAGVSSSDSHVPDREPVYVGVNDSGDVETVLFDQYHYLLGTRPAPATDDAGRPLLKVIEPWHPYQPTRDVGELVELADLHERYQSWLENGWGVDPESVVDPPRVLERGHWWDDDSWALLATASLSLQFYKLNQRLPFEVPLPGRET